MALFEPAFDFVMSHEDARREGKVTIDKGGVTKWGIASRYHPGIDVAALTLEDARGIYLCYYWECYALAQLHSQRIASKICDMLVNPGPYSARLVQEIIGVKVDGRIGAFTIGKLNLMDEEGMITQLCLYQATYYRIHDADSPALADYIRRAADRPPITLINPIAPL